jgi:hypothetical protein
VGGGGRPAASGGARPRSRRGKGVLGLGCPIHHGAQTPATPLRRCGALGRQQATPTGFSPHGEPPGDLLNDGKVADGAAHAGGGARVCGGGSGARVRGQGGGDLYRPGERAWASGSAGQGRCGTDVGSDLSPARHRRKLGDDGRGPLVSGCGRRLRSWAALGRNPVGLRSGGGAKATG